VHPDVSGLLCLAIGLGAVIGVVVYLRRHGDPVADAFLTPEARRLRQAPLRKIADLRAGEDARIRGVVRGPPDRDALRSPLETGPVVLWSMVVWGYRRKHRFRMLDRAEGCDFFVDDGSGVARVGGRDSILLTERISRGTVLTWPHLAARLPKHASTIEIAELGPGDTVTVLGRVRMERDPDAPEERTASDGYREGERSTVAQRPVLVRDVAPVLVGLGAPHDVEPDPASIGTS
jgi:hypothetical protein